MEILLSQEKAVLKTLSKLASVNTSREFLVVIGYIILLVTLERKNCPVSLTTSEPPGRSAILSPQEKADVGL